MKFRKKPVVIEAIQWTGKNLREVVLFLEYAEVENDFLENWNMKAMVGDWIIKGVSNEFYLCKPDIFAKTYEPVPEPPSAAHFNGS